MSPEILASQALAVLAPYLVKGAEEVASSVAKDLWNKVKSIFKSKNKDSLLDSFSKDPNDTKIQGKIEYVLQEEFENNSSLLNEFENILQELKTKSDNNSIIKQSGNENIAIGGQIKNSRINVNK